MIFIDAAKNPWKMNYVNRPYLSLGYSLCCQALLGVAKRRQATQRDTPSDA